MKYASRHALYPVPNVFDCVDDIIAARDARDALVVVRLGSEELFFCVALRVTEFFLFVVVRATTGVRTGLDMSRDADDVVVRAGATFVFCCFVVARDVVARDTVVFVFVRAVVVRDVVCVSLFCVVRDIEFALRTAASAMPTPTIYAIMKIQIRFIPCL